MEDAQIVFLDTPGIHKAKNKLGDYMVNVAEHTLNEVDVVLWLVEPGTYIGVVPPKRSGASFCKVGQTVIMFGGQSEVTHYNDVWMLDISLVHFFSYRSFLNI